MTRNQLTPEQRQRAETFFDTHSRWDFAMSVNVEAHRRAVGGGGKFGWHGGYGTSVYSNPKKKEVVRALLT